MMQEIEELWALADECREWSFNKLLSKEIQEEYLRLSKQLNEIAKRLAARLPT